MGRFFGLVVMLEVRAARFLLVQNTKTGKKYTKLPQNIPKGNKIFPMAVKYNCIQQWLGSAS
jgi:hypothetical protein